MYKETDKYSELFESFLRGEEISLQNEYKESDFRFYVYQAISAIQKGDVKAFKKGYDAIKERKLNEDSPWVYDDILLIVFAIGTVKFECSNEWIKSLSLLRINHQSGEEKSLTESIHFFVGSSKSGLKHIHILAYDLSGKTSDLTDNFIVQSYVEAQNLLKNSDNELYKIIAHASIRSVVKYKGLDNIELRKKRNQFIENFKIRLKQVSNWIYWVTFISLIPLSIYLSLLVIEINEGMSESALKTYFNNLITPIISIGSYTLFFFKRKKIMEWIEGLIHRFWSDFNLNDLVD